MWIKKKEIEQLSEFVKGYSSGEELDIRENKAVSYTHLRAHETDSYLVCRLLLEKKKKKRTSK